MDQDKAEQTSLGEGLERSGEAPTVEVGETEQAAERRLHCSCGAACTAEEYQEHLGRGHDAGLSSGLETADQLTGLLLCPFCPDGGDVWLPAPQHPIRCSKCGAEGPRCATDEESKRRWNTRASQWQPIETAPKDGKEVLLAWNWDSGLHQGRSVVLAAWRCRAHSFLSSDHNCPNDLSCDMSWDAYGGRMTHWMPLPDPPKSS